MKRYLVPLIGIILVTGGVLFEEKHRAGTIKNSIAHTESNFLRPMLPPVGTESGFSDYADLWGNPGLKNSDPGTVQANLIFQNEPVPAGFEKIQAKLDDKSEPVLTVQDREAVYAIFSAGGFKLTLNLKPGYPTPEALLPTRVDPGIGGSFSF